jgi:hypothetical protein
MYSRKSGLTLGFHGCDEDIIKSILLGKELIKHSNNAYDWLGHGIYFWEGSPSRAWEYANTLKNNPLQATSPIKKPAVIGAIIDLGHCLDFLDYENLQLLKTAHDFLIETNIKSGKPIPSNKKGKESSDLLLRNLDCAVIETLHKVRRENDLTPYDSVKGVFWEGKEIYHDAGFREKDHIQLCIINPNCIKGFFLPRSVDLKYNYV